MKHAFLPQRLIAMSLVGTLALILAWQFSPPLAQARRGDDDDAPRARSRQVQSDDFSEDEDFPEDDFDMGEQLHVYKSLLSLIQQFDVISKDKTSSAIAAMLGAEDHFEDPMEVVEFLERMLKRSDNASVRRAIRLKILDLYDQTDQHEKVVRELENLILEK